MIRQNFNKEEKRVIRQVLKTCILRRHKQWQDEMRQLLDSPMEPDSNEFDRSMEITRRSRDFFKEAMQMEDFYRYSRAVIGLRCLYAWGLMTEAELATLPADVIARVTLD